MARPSKNSCDYFPHDNGMRNHVKIKAIRNKFENGYSIWVMFLEFLTGSDGNVFEYNDLQFELLSGDFGVSATEIKNVIDYALKLELIFNKNGYINSDSLDERLSPVYAKRGKSKEQSAKQKRDNGKYTTGNTVNTAVSVTEIPQSKVKEIKEKKKRVGKIFQPPTLNEVQEYFKENGFSIESAKKAFKYYDCENWHDKNGVKVKSWKQKMQGVWFKDENKVIEQKQTELSFEPKYFDIPNDELFGYPNDILLERCKQGIYKRI